MSNRIDIHLFIHSDSAAQGDRVIHRIDNLEIRLMATAEELKGELVTIRDGVLAQKALIQELRDQIAAGTPVSQAQLDELDGIADEVVAALTPEAPPEG